MNEYDRAVLTVDTSLALLILAGLYDQSQVARSLRVSLVELEQLGAVYPPARLVLRAADRAMHITNVLSCFLPDSREMPEDLRSWLKMSNDDIAGATPLELLGTAEGVNTVSTLLARHRQEQEGTGSPVWP